MTATSGANRTTLKTKIVAKKQQRTASRVLLHWGNLNRRQQRTAIDSYRLLETSWNTITTIMDMGMEIMDMGMGIMGTGMGIMGTGMEIMDMGMEIMVMGMGIVGTGMEIMGTGMDMDMGMESMVKMVSLMASWAL